MQSTLLYACETWTVYQRHATRLNHFHTSCLRKFLKIKGQYRIPDKEVLKRAGMQSEHTLLKLAQLRWTGHYTLLTLAQLRWTGHLPECLMNVCQRKSSMENYKSENAPIMARKSDTRAPSKPPLKTLSYQQSWKQIAQDQTHGGAS